MLGHHGIDGALDLADPRIVDLPIVDGHREALVLHPCAGDARQQ